MKYDYDQRMDFSGYKTYAWVGGTNLPDELNHARIVAAVDSQLRAKGFTRVDSTGNPDVLVVYRVGMTHDLEINGYGHRYASRTGPTSARVERVVMGTLAVGMIDAATRAVVWRAAATKEIDPEASPEKREKSINKAVEKMFERYPSAK